MLAAFLCVLLSHIAAVCYGRGRMDSALLFNPDTAAYGTAFGPHVRVATTTIDGQLQPASVTAQAWIMPLPRTNGQLYTGPNDLGQVLGNMARTFTPSRIFAGYSIYCKDSSANEFSCSFFVATSTTSFLEPSCRVPMQNWTHVTGVYDSSTGVADIFLNGSKCASSANSGGGASISYFLRSSFLVGGWIEDAPGAAAWARRRLSASHHAVYLQAPPSRRFISPEEWMKFAYGPALEHAPKFFPTCSTQSRSPPPSPRHRCACTCRAMTARTPPQ